MTTKELSIYAKVLKSIYEEEDIFTKDEIIAKLNKQSICPHEISVGSVKNLISSLVGSDLEVASGGKGRAIAFYRNKVDYRLRLLEVKIPALRVG